jgi:hypothetical protein
VQVQFFQIRVTNRREKSIYMKERKKERHEREIIHRKTGNPEIRGSSPGCGVPIFRAIFLYIYMTGFFRYN